MKLFLASQASETLPLLIPLLDKSPKDIRVALVPTAADLYKNHPWLDDDKNSLQKLGFPVKIINIKDKTEEDLEKALIGIDLIFVGGGNTFYLLEKAKKSGFDKLVKKLVKNGIWYVGSSAGSVIAGPDIESVAAFDDREEADLISTTAFGFVDFVVLPHYGKGKSGVLHEKVLKEFGEKYKIIPITNQQVILVDESGYKILENK